MEIVKKKEGERILSKLPANSFAVTLCVEGKELSSTELAAKISDISMTSSNITFIIGGSLGLSDDAKSASQLRLSFGRITLPHQLIRVVLLEQLYRALKFDRKVYTNDQSILEYTISIFTSDKHQYQIMMTE